MGLLRPQLRCADCGHLVLRVRTATGAEGWGCDPCTSTSPAVAEMFRRAGMPRCPLGCRALVHETLPAPTQGRHAHIPFPYPACTTAAPRHRTA